jgi:AcrR family transcriptional regulator
VLRLAARDGLAAVSLRAVAVESGLNIGSVRHYFDGQRDLMRFAMRSTIDRVAARVSARVASTRAAAPDEAAERLLDLLSELLPLDAARRTEAAVLVEFLVAARTDPDLADLAQEAVRGTVSLARRVLEGVARRRELTAEEREAQAQQLAALLDGLTFRAVLAPEVATAEDCVQALRTHLAALLGPV